MRREKINYLSVGFVQSRFVQKIPEWTGLLLNCLCTTVSVKTERIFALKSVEASHFSNLMDRIMWG